MNANNDINNLLLIRFTVVKEKGDYFICKDCNNKKYKLIKSDETKKLSVGTDTTQYVKKIGQSLFIDVIELLTKEEEYKLTSKQSKTLKDMGLTLSDIYKNDDNSELVI